MLEEIEELDRRNEKPYRVSINYLSQFILSSENTYDSNNIVQLNMIEVNDEKFFFWRPPIEYQIFKTTPKQGITIKK